MSRDIVVIIATRYALDGPGIESQWRRDLPHTSRPVLGPTRPPIRWVLGLSRGRSGRGVALTTHPYLALRLNEEWSYKSTPPLSLLGLFLGELYLCFYLIVFGVLIRLQAGPSGFRILPEARPISFLQIVHTSSVGLPSYLMI
jgi:hypothetical protein